MINQQKKAETKIKTKKLDVKNKTDKDVQKQNKNNSKERKES